MKKLITIHIGLILILFIALSCAGVLNNTYQYKKKKHVYKYKIHIALIYNIYEKAVVKKIKQRIMNKIAEKRKKILKKIKLDFSVFSKKNRKIVNAICAHESNGIPTAIGDRFSKNNYSVGLCQIRLKTAKAIVSKLPKNNILRIKYGKGNLNDIKKMLLNPIYNKYIANVIVSKLYRYHKNWKQTIISYNTGRWARKKIRETKGVIYFKNISRHL